MKRILVTGSTGFIGYEVSRLLASQGRQPRLMVRRPLRGPLVSPLEAEIIQGDLESLESLERAVDGIDTIIHLAARATFEDYSVLSPTIVGGSVALMKAAKKADVKNFVYSSSLLVYSNQTQPIGKDTPAGTKVGYGRAKLEAEKTLSEMAQEAGIRFAAVRLPHVYGARNLIFEQVRRGWVIFPGKGKKPFAHLHEKDAARVLIHIADTDWSGKSAVADNLAASWKEFYDVIHRYHPRFRVIHVPKWMALLMTRFLSTASRLRSTPFLYTPGGVIGWNLALPVQTGLLWEELGIEPEYPTIYDGIPAVLDDSVAYRWLHPLADRK
jgi:nucleoside-diphosphate-sugar epimerase